ncbi:hypothetical protein BAUCODRAFT_372980 [Baudoinia panamericana UAMH 10762]|uniref:Uncharacterized protein n=1 Tax=Baudoinia panamericana (strain UAMH 10762) TaxID=717646 RepID=M2NLD7_BAUPA|nr:uncharacterized protein BAUCODRAFT_372980 [Baudoinia panamericana UAMH 10762]EMD00300.1 hypothetical protein BAUCODRAFT_372980 [Baudoinia panamericana UAMH 10762]
MPGMTGLICTTAVDVSVVVRQPIEGLSHRFISLCYSNSPSGRKVQPDLPYLDGQGQVCSFASLTLIARSAEQKRNHRVDANGRRNNRLQRARRRVPEAGRIRNCDTRGSLELNEAHFAVAKSNLSATAWRDGFAKRNLILSPLK